MERVIAIFLSCLLLSASSLLASSAEETYQAALTQEKGEGNLEEAIRLYQQVIEAHEKGEGDEKMAARAQLRIGVCQEKLGLAQARQTYEAVRDKYPDQPQVGAEAARRLGSTHQREAVIEEPSHRTASESYIRRQLQQGMERAKRQMELTERQMEAIQQQLREQAKQGMELAERQMETIRRQITEQTKWRVEQAKQGTDADSVFIDEQVRRQLEALQQQMEQAERQTKQAKQQIDWQNQSIHGPPFYDDILEHWRYLGTDRKAAIKEFFRRATNKDLVAEVPKKWKFYLDADRQPMERPSRFHEYAPADFDDSKWTDIEIGRTWAEQGHVDYEGGTWYRAKFTIAADQVRPVQMYIEGKYRTIEVYINGHSFAFISSFNIMERPLIIDIGRTAVRDGENTVALYVYGGTDTANIDRVNMYQPIVNWASLGSEKEAGQQYSTYANSPAVVPYSYKKVAKVPTQWKFRLDERRNPRSDHGYAALGFDDSEWAAIKIGQAWEAQGYAGYNGGAWYRTQIEVDAKEGQPVHLAFGGVDQHATVYVNGQWVGEHNKWSRPFILDISDQVMRDGENAVALYVFDGGGMGGIYGTVQVIQPTKEKNLDHYLANRSGATW